MTLMDWLNMNLIADITFLVFAAAAVWKIRKLEKTLEKLRNDLNITMKNPMAAKKILRERKK